MVFTAQQIADFLKGTVIGNPDVKVSDLSKIEDGKPGTLTFLSNPKYAPYLYNTQASIVLVNNDFEPEEKINATLIKVADAYQSLAMLLDLVEQSKPRKKGISPLACVAATAQIGKDVYIAPLAFVGDNAIVNNNAQIYPHAYVGDNATIGENSVLFAGATVYDGCVVGNRCILHAGCVIGSDGFGFAPQADGSYKKIPQIGNVVIEDDVEIGANTTLDCATMGSSLVRRGVKLDNLVHLAHNVEVGENTAIAAQCGVAGSTKIGKQCILAGQVGLVGHISVADGSIFGAQSGINTSIKEANQTWLGSPANPVAKTRRIYAVTRNLPDLQNEIIALKKEMAELKEKLIANS
ncbi:MAG: UDP-3-O-(3-hydroxymyristoyl)glucosamine N-acyltransferase [Prevotellaceae bacterium]|jgi:UDP-3-O-[3-hydroxymyristoyl] glucosamine N-acyltransferase|nr:UDP-3-O-(3-hydroxymyristoyl)glucosamine N-acyltransferase [Prevotellaceae bacterium]